MFFSLYYILFYYFISVLALSAAVSSHSTPVAIYYLGTFIIGYLEIHWILHISTAQL